MKKYNLSEIMKLAWAYRKEGMTMSAALKASWAKAKNPRTEVKMCVVGKETFTVNARTGVVVGKTYNSRTFLKDNFDAAWDAAAKQWSVNVDKFNSELNSYPDYYKKYIVSESSGAAAAPEEKEIVYRKLVNREDGFYSFVEYRDGTHAYIFMG